MYTKDKEPPTYAERIIKRSVSLSSLLLYYISKEKAAIYVN